MAGTADRVRTFVYLALFAYFGLRIRGSVSKYYEARVGTSSETRHARYMTYPSFTICPVMPSNWSGGAHLNGVLGATNVTKDMTHFDTADTLIFFSHSFEKENG